jgi:DNA-binding response OmpR family regulator
MILLIAEDETELRSALAETLEREGFKVIATASGTEALRRLDEAAGSTGRKPRAPKRTR